VEIDTVVSHCNICGGEVETPADTLRSLELAPQLIAEAVRTSRHSAGRGWSPAEVAAHLADTEIVEGWRVRQVLSKDEPHIDPYDQDAWASALHYGTRDTDLALLTFAAVRRANLELLRDLPDDAWQRA